MEGFTSFLPLSESTDFQKRDNFLHFRHFLVAIASNCLKLGELDVSGSMITDSGIAALTCAIQLNLQILSISRCRLVSDKSLPYFVKLGLVGLNLQDCDGINSRAVGRLVERLWHCDILS
ncbi:hypothetical protein L6452_08819 [Arctium lappa]|uniref:Uncharacterized protein n=1 Tax=Arctium lappa TaxID=4217 RepID=A0ACB9DJ53_ARCLA|nr:hypothetical protein L6452_08819 [Arctium lappa]